MRFSLDQALESLRQSLLIIFAAISTLGLPRLPNLDMVRAAGIVLAVSQSHITISLGCNFQIKDVLLNSRSDELVTVVMRCLQIMEGIQVPVDCKALAKCKAKQGADRLRLSGCPVPMDEEARKAIKSAYCENIGSLFHIVVVYSLCSFTEDSTSSVISRMMSKISRILVDSMLRNKVHVIDEQVFNGQMCNDQNLRTLRDLGLSV